MYDSWNITDWNYSPCTLLELMELFLFFTHTTYPDSVFYLYFTNKNFIRDNETIPISVPTQPQLVSRHSSVHISVPFSCNHNLLLSLSSSNHLSTTVSGHQPNSALRNPRRPTFSSQKVSHNQALFPLITNSVWLWGKSPHGKHLICQAACLIYVPPAQVYICAIYFLSHLIYLLFFVILSVYPSECTEQVSALTGPKLRWVSWSCVPPDSLQPRHTKMCYCIYSFF